MNRWTRLLSLAILFLALGAPAALAQTPNANDTLATKGEQTEESEGDPVPGYVATSALVFAAMFAICKSARR
jgi:hypothetical protein